MFTRRKTSLHVAAVTALVAGLLGAAAPVAHAVTPTNDRIQHAKEITSLPYRDEIDTSDATSSASDPDCFGKIRTVWYEYTAPANGQIAASTFGSGYNTNLAVYVGEPDLETQMACVDDSRGNVTSRVSIGTIAGETYFIRVGSTGAEQGGSLVFTLEQVFPPANDSITQARAIGPLPFTDEQDTSEASTVSGDPACITKLRTVWFTFTPRQTDLDESNVVVVTTAGSDYAATVSVYTGTPGNLQQVACSGGAARFAAQAGQSYYVMIGSQTIDGGNLKLTVQNVPPPPPPANLKLRVNRTGFQSLLTGDAAVQGTIECSKQTRVTVGLTLRQRGSRTGSSERFTCENKKIAWSVSASGNFKKGEAAAEVTLYPSDGGSRKRFEGTVRLTPCTLIGTAGRDKLAGLAKDDILCGMAGDDNLIGRGGNDKLRGGGGEDRLEGGPGNDDLQGSFDADTLIGGPGRDVCNSGSDKGDKVKSCERKIKS
ncbi:MAG TPA: calcium-binding protein [Actinomycetota bacterium]|jgi:Ca2+-binding RTX toxin-like protein